MNEKECTRENKMATMPENKLLITMALPMIISMLIQSLYNVVDSLFVSRISTDALDAVSLSFTVQNLMIGVATGTAVGVNALLSRSLGEHDFGKAKKIAENGVFLSIIGYIIFLCFAFFGNSYYFSTFAHDVTQETIACGKTYLFICTSCSFGLFLSIMFERLMQSSGNTIYTMFSQGTGAIINMILDPVFIFVFDMGISGAAWATVTGQIASLLISYFCNRKINKDIPLSIRDFRPDLGIIGRIYAIGIPSMIMVGIGSVMYYLISKILGTFKQTAITIFGIYYKLQSFVFMPLFGLNNGLIPIIAFNYGANKRKRITKSIKLAVMYAIIIMAIGLLIFQLFPSELIKIFEGENGRGDLIETGVPALRTISLSFVFAGFCIVMSSVFQAFGKGVLSMIVSIARQMLVLVPAAYLLAQTGALCNVWWAFPIAELASLTASVISFLWIWKKIIRRIPLP